MGKLVVRQKRAFRTAITQRRAQDLLFPVAAFLQAGGMSRQNAERCFKAAFKRAAREVSIRKIQHIGHPTLYADIVARWTRDKRFLDKAGRPADLPLSGKNGFRALVRTTCPADDPRSVLKVLIRYGTVKRHAAGRYRLVQPFFVTSTSREMAFEPIAFFLSDATRTLTHIIRRTGASRSPDLFWRKVENADLPRSATRAFLAFAKERSLAFLEEIDDWLEANARVERRKARCRRVGLGLFAICSEPEVSATRRTRHPLR